MAVNMTQLQLDFWNLVLSVISTSLVIILAIAGGFRYFQERKRDRETRQEELAWRKTQFILELAEDFEKDVQHQVAWKLLTYGTGLPKNSTLTKILGENTNVLTKTEMQLRYAIDDYLDFFDRLYHFTFVTHALNVADIEVFGWYIAQIGETREIHEYAKGAGFEDVLGLNMEFQKLFGKKHWYKTIRKTRPIHQDNGVRKLVSNQKVKGNDRGSRR
jgi:hypothetical protein